MKKKLKLKKSKVPQYKFGGDSSADNEYLGGEFAAAGVGALGGAATGAQIGSVIPGVGTAIGAGAGALIGGTAGFFKQRQQDKNAYEAELAAKQNKPITPFQPYMDAPMNNDPYNYFKDGGMIPLDNTIEVEGKELETSSGRILKDFNKQPSHKDGGYQYEAKPDRTIIPTKWRSRYMEGDKTTRTSIERNLVNDQVAREETKRTAFNALYKRKMGGLTVPKYYKGGVSDYDPNNNPFFNQESDGTFGGPGSSVNSYFRNNPNEQFSSPADAPRSISSLRNFSPSAMENPQSTQLNTGFAQSPGLDTSSLSGLAGNNTPNIGRYLNTAAQLAPLAYNTIKAFQKPEVLNQEEYQNPYETQSRNMLRERTKRLGDRRVDFHPIETGIRNDYSSSLQSLASGAKSSGQALSLGSKLAGSRANSIALAKMKTQEANNAYAGEAANALGDEASAAGRFGSERARTKLGIKDINDRNKAARDNFGAAAATDISKYAQGSNRDEIYNNMLEDMFNNYKYDSKTKKYSYKRS